MLAWHFMPEDKSLRYGDERCVRKGRWLVHRGKLEMCVSGLHASKLIIDALQYAPGPVIARVELGGKIIYEDDKCVAERRKVLWWFNAEGVLRRFACRCALDVAHLWDMPDIVRQYLMTQDKSIEASAGAAAWDAAANAVGAAFHASHAAALAATTTADADAAYAASAAARTAIDVEDKQNRRLTSMVIAEAKRIGEYR